MSAKKKDVWRAEQEREERKKRLAKSKASKGGRIKTSSFNWAKFITILVIAVFVVGFFTVDIFSRGIPHRHITAVSVDRDKMSAAEYNFYYFTAYNNFLNQYYDYLSYFGLDINQPLNRQYYSETMTWEQYFHDEALYAMQQVSILSELAKADNMRLTGDEYGSVDNYIQSIKDFCAANSIKIGDYYSTSYGKGVNEQVLRAILEKQHLADKYSASKRASFVFDDEQITEHYNNNADTFDVVDYRMFFMSGEPPYIDPEDEHDEYDGHDHDDDFYEEYYERMEQAAVEAWERAWDRSWEMVERLAGGVSFSGLVVEYADENSRAYYESDPEATLYRATLKTDIADADIAEWLFAEGRESRDATVIETDTGFYVVSFLSRYRNEYNTVSARHILISTRHDDGGFFTDEEKAVAQAEAESVYEEWKNGEATEDSFAALAGERSADGGSTATGGLYEDIPRGYMVPEFEDWI